MRHVKGFVGEDKQLRRKDGEKAAAMIANEIHLEINKVNACKMQQRFILGLGLPNIMAFATTIALSPPPPLCCTKHHIIDNSRLYVETLMILRSNIHTITFKTQKSSVSFKQFSVDS